MTIYENGKIYRIEVINGGDVGDVYYGSTTKRLLSQRMSNHRNLYRSWKAGKSNHTASFILFEKYGLDGCQIVLVENVENCKSKDELHAKEAYYIKTNECVNKYIPLRTPKEYREDNREHTKEIKKKYKLNNQDKLIEKSRNYYLNNKEKIKELKKQYCEDNREKISKNKKQYAELNTEKIKEYDKKRYEESKQNKIDCSCGGFYHSRTKSQHCKSKRHQAFLCGNV